MNGKKGFVPRWLMKSPEELQENVLLLLKCCNAVVRFANPNGAGDEADLEGARDDLGITLKEIFEKNGGVPENNPLWEAVMMIRPQVINGRLRVSVTNELAQAMWELKKKTEEKEPGKAEFFGRLAGRLRQHQISFFRAVISGGLLMVKNENQWRPHYFPGIPFPVRKEAGVKLTTHPDNLQVVVAAYGIMVKKTSGYAEAALEAVIADIMELSQNLYPQKK